MQRLSKYAVLASLVFLLTQCNNKGKEIEGKWQIKTWYANGAILSDNVFGTSVWQFEKDKYSVQIANLKDEGNYHINKDSLFMKSETSPDRPEVYYLIKQIDTVQLVLGGSINGNKSEITFAKVNQP